MSSYDGQSWIVTLATRCYSWIIRHGPKEFLQEFERNMLLDFRLLCCEAYKQRGAFGILRLCPPLFISAVVDMRAEKSLSATNVKNIKLSNLANDFVQNRFHPLLYLGIGMLATLGLWTIYFFLANWLSELGSAFFTTVIAVLALLFPRMYGTRRKRKLVMKSEISRKGGE